MRPEAYGLEPLPRGNDLQVALRTRAVASYDLDPRREGRPVALLLGGAAVALTAMVLIAMLAFNSFYEQRISEDRAYFGISLLFCFYVLGVFLFCYAYELYDLPAALRLTIIAALISLVFLVLVIVSLATLAKMKEGVGAFAAESEVVAKGPLAQTALSYMAGDDPEAVAAAEARRRHAGFEEFITPEVRPFLVNCQGCGHMFTPAPPAATCPFCGRQAVSV